MRDGITHRQAAGILVLLSVAVGLQLFDLLRTEPSTIHPPLGEADGRAQLRVLHEILAALEQGPVIRSGAAPAPAVPAGSEAGQGSAERGDGLVRASLPGPSHDPQLASILRRIEALLRRPEGAGRRLLPRGSQVAELRRPLDRNAVLAFARALDQDEGVKQALMLQPVDEAVRRFGLPTDVNIGQAGATWEYRIRAGEDTAAKLSFLVIGGVISKAWSRVY